jgi:hypothetical protein
VITGRFPTRVPVYVWFGQSAIVRATSYGDHLELETPAVGSAAVVDVSVLFRTSSEHELTLPRAFTYTAPQPPSGGSTGGSVSTTLPTGAPATTVPTAPPITPPASTTTAPAPATTTTTTAPTTTVAPPGGGGSTGGSDGGSGGGSAWTRQRGSLTLRPVSSGSSLSALSAARWPSTSCTSTCTGTTL